MKQEDDERPFPLEETMETSPLLKGQRPISDAAMSEEHGALRSAPPYSKAAVTAVFFFPALGGLLFGYDIGATSSVLTQLESSTYSGVSWYEIVDSSTLLQGIITSSGVLGAMVGSVICFNVENALGRRRELLIAAMLYFIGSLVEYYAGWSLWTGDWGLVVLMTGRITYGLACGFAMHGAPAYIGEMSPAAVRGVLVSMKEAMIVVGMLLGYTIGWILDDTVGGWRTTYGVASVFAVLMFVGMFFMPPSARWLVLSGRIDAARKALQFVTPGISELAIAEIQASAEKNEVAREVGFEALWAPACRQALVVGLGLVTLQQGMFLGLHSIPIHGVAFTFVCFSNLWPNVLSRVLDVGGFVSTTGRNHDKLGVESPLVHIWYGLLAIVKAACEVTGQPSVLYYADTIFEDVGLDTLASVLVAAFKLVATLIAVFTVDKHGRVRLLTIGCSLMLAALLALTIAFMFDYVSDSDCNAYTSETSCVDYSSQCGWDSGCSCTSSSSSGSTSYTTSDCECCSASGISFQKGCILAAMFVYIGGYQVGFGPVVWLIISEVFPLEVRGKAISLAVVANFGFNLVVTLVFPSELTYLGSAWTFLIFGLIDAYAIYFIKTNVPETKGLSLEQIEALFSRKGRRDQRAALSRD